MDIILIQSPCWGLYAPPLGLASLAAFLRNKGIQVLTLDLNIDMYYRCRDEYKIYWEEAAHEFWRNESLVEKFFLDSYELINSCLTQICNCDAKIVGFSVHDTSMFFSLALAKKIKERCKDILIVFGGPHCSQCMAGNFIISQSSVNIVVEGEGEETLLEIIELVKRGGQIDFCAGTLIKKDNEIIYCGDRPLVKNLDDLPFSDFSGFPVENYIRERTLPVSTSRGCVNRCVFCNEWPYWKRYRYKSGYYLFQEIKYLLSKYTHVRNIEFYDSLLNGNLKELSTLCDLIIKDGLKIRWSGQAIIRGMDTGLLTKFKASGCGCLDYGLESASQRVIDKIRKGFHISDAERIIRQTYEAGIDVVLNFMFGLPGETEDDFNETLEFLSRNRNYITVVNPSPSFCGIAQGTYLYNHPEEFDISTPITNGLFWKTNDYKNNYLVRLDRFERFCELVQTLGIKSTYPGTTLVNRYRIIGDYYFHMQDYSKALQYYQISVEKEGENNKILQLIDHCHRFLNQPV